MTFHEKSACLMAFVLFVASALYAYVLSMISSALGHLASPAVPGLIAYTILIVVMSIVGHILIALLKPADANQLTDERDRTVSERAGHWSGYVLGAGVLTSLGVYVITQSGDLLFYLVFFSVVVAQIAEYLLQLLLYRLGV